jgi:hypothetical protein
MYNWSIPMLMMSLLFSQISMGNMFFYSADLWHPWPVCIGNIFPISRRLLMRSRWRLFGANLVRKKIFRTSYIKWRCWRLECKQRSEIQVSETVKIEFFCLTTVVVYFNFRYTMLAKKSGKKRAKYVENIGKIIKAETYTKDSVFVDSDGIIFCWLFPKLLTGEEEGCLFLLLFYCYLC